MFVSIVTIKNERIVKFLEFDTLIEAAYHANEYGGFVWENANNDHIKDLKVVGQTVTIEPIIPVITHRQVKQAARRRINLVQSDHDQRNDNRWLARTTIEHGEFVNWPQTKKNKYTNTIAAIGDDIDLIRQKSKDLRNPALYPVIPLDFDDDNVYWSN